jgi:putative FmdB family regulatory protein
VPVYEYQCTSCGEKSQRLQKLGEDSSGSKCLTCGDGILKKTFSPFGTAGSSDVSCADEHRSRFR